MVPTGSRKPRKLGIRLERRWLSIMFTAPKIAALSSAVLTQLKSLVLTSREIFVVKAYTISDKMQSFQPKSPLLFVRYFSIMKPVKV